MDHDQLDQRLRTGVRIPTTADHDRVERILGRIDGEPRRRRSRAAALAVVIGASVIAVLAASRPTPAPRGQSVVVDTTHADPVEDANVDVTLAIEQPLKIEGEQALADARDAVNRVVSDLPPSVAERLGRVFGGRS